MGFGGNAGMLVCEMLWCSYYLLIGCCVLIFSSYPYLFFFLFFLCFFLLGFAPSYSQPAMEQKPTPVQQAYYIFLLCFVLCLHTRIHIHTFFLFDLILFYFISSFMKLVLNAKVSCWERKSNLHLWKRSLKKVVIFFSISVAYFRVKCCFQNWCECRMTIDVGHFTDIKTYFFFFFVQTKLSQKSFVLNRIKNKSMCKNKDSKCKHMRMQKAFLQILLLLRRHIRMSNANRM